VGGGVGEVVEMSPSGTHGIIELSEDMEDGLAQGDRVAVHISDMSHVNGEEEPVDVDDLDPEDDVPYESTQVGEGKKGWTEKPEHRSTSRAAAADWTPAGTTAEEERRKEAQSSYMTRDKKKLGEDCGCQTPGHDHSSPTAHGVAIKMSDNDLTDRKKPIVKVGVLKKKPKLPGSIMRAITSALGLESTVNEQEYEEREPFLGPFRQQRSRDEDESEGWTAEETVEWHSQDVIAAGADFLDQELLDPKVNSLDDVHQDLVDDLAGMVIHRMQKDGNLPKRLDYNDYLDERDEYKTAIEAHLGQHFDEMVDLADKKAIKRGDRPDIEPHEDPNDPWGDTPDRFANQQ
jgi:hypothetical protein